MAQLYTPGNGLMTRVQMGFILKRALTGSFEATISMIGVGVGIVKGQTFVALGPTEPVLEGDKLKVSM